MSPLSQPPGRPDPPSAQGCQEERPSLNEEYTTRRVSHSRAVGGLGKVAVLTASRGQRDTQTFFLFFKAEACKRLFLPSPGILKNNYLKV